MNGNLEAGVARADITPPVGVHLCGFAARKGPSRGVQDRLEAKALFLDDGCKSFAIVTADIIGLSRGDNRLQPYSLGAEHGYGERYG